jgi:hypothetical protein
MRRIQIYLDEWLDEALQREAARTGRSKAALVRECLSHRFRSPGRRANDPFDELIGSIDVEPAVVDDTVYPQASERGQKSSRTRTELSASARRW